MLISLVIVGGAVAVGVRILLTPTTAPRPALPPEPEAAPLDEAASGDPPTVDAPGVDPEGEEDDDARAANVIVESERLEAACALSGTALALSAAGLVVPPLAAVSVVPATIAMVPYFQRVWRLRHDRRQRWVGLSDSLYMGGSLVTGHVFAACLTLVLVYGSLILLRKTRRDARDDLGHIFGELPNDARVLRDGGEVVVPLPEVRLDDRVIVYAGSVVPVDGVVIAGRGAVDERALTGESQPVDKIVGDPVLASTLVTEGPLVVRVIRTGADTTVGRLHGVLQNTDDLTEHHRTIGQTLVEQGAVPTLAMTAATLPVLGLTRALAMNGASFGYHMRLAAPVSVLGYIALAARQGVLVKDGRALELLTAVDTVLFDKTGTLSMDRPEIVAVRPRPGFDARGLLRVAAAVEVGQTHPIARAILDAATAEGIPIEPADRIEVSIGAGVRAWVDGEPVRIGSGRLMALDGIPIPDDLVPDVPGSAPVFVAVGGRLAGLFEVVTPARPEARAVVDALRSRGVEVGLVTGDRWAPARRLAADLGIEQVHAEVLPEEKAALVQGLQARGRRVCFVGDGINDVIALKTADVSISLSGASEAATDTAGLVMLDGDLKRLPEVFALADGFERNIGRGKVITVVPGIVLVGSVHLLYVGLTGAIMIYNASLVVAMVNAFEPIVRDRRGRGARGGGGARPLTVDGPLGAPSPEDAPGADTAVGAP